MFVSEDRASAFVDVRSHTIDKKLGINDLEDIIDDSLIIFGLKSIGSYDISEVLLSERIY